MVLVGYNPDQDEEGDLTQTLDQECLSNHLDPRGEHGSEGSGRTRSESVAVFCLASQWSDLFSPSPSSWFVMLLPCFCREKRSGSFPVEILPGERPKPTAESSCVGA